MFTIRNIGGAALLLFGSTFLWLTPSFASAGVSTRGAMWSVTGVLALVVVAGFTAATWGLFTNAGWWEPTALASAALGILVVVPYWLAASHAGETTPGFNALIHLLGDVGVFALLLTPTLEKWVHAHVAAGR